ncbi:hypothetical protein JXQ70_01035 [bacterium]|nr:hypothetical protein [bacterium]
MVLLFWWPLVFFGQTYCFADLMSLHLPHRHYILQAIRLGKIPLWSHLIQGGFPLHAEGELGILYPLNLIMSLFQIEPPYMINISILFHTFLALTGMYTCGRRLDYTHTAAFLIGIAYAFSGFATVHTMQLNMRIGMAVLPWIGVALSMMIEQPRSIQANLLLGSCLGLQFLGSHPQISFYNILFLVGFMFCYFLFFIMRHKYRMGRDWLINTGTALFWGCMLGAAQWLPTMELVPFSPRTRLFPQTMGALNLKGLLVFLVPTVWGGTSEPNGLRAHFLLDFFHEHAHYIGILPLLLIVLILIGRTRFSTDTHYKYVLCVPIVISFIWAFGENGLLSRLYYCLPLTQNFTCPFRMLHITGFFLLLLSGLGLTRVEQGGYTLTRKRWLVGLCIVGISTFFLIFSIRSHLLTAIDAGKTAKILFSLSILAFCTLLLTIVFRTRWRTLIKLMPFLVFIELYFFFGDYNPTQSITEYNKTNEMAELLHKRAGANQRIYSFIQLGNNTISPELLPFDTPVRYNLANLATSFSLSLQEPRERMNALHSSYRIAATGIVITDNKPFQEQGIRFLLSQKPIKAHNISLVNRINEVYLYEFTFPIELISLQKDNRYFPVEDWSIDWGDNQVNLKGILPETQTQHPYLLTLKDNYYPGWFAADQDGLIPLHNNKGLKMIACKGTAEPTPLHIRLDYRPFSYHLGFFMSLIGLLCLSMLSIFKNRQPVTS